MRSKNHVQIYFSMVENNARLRTQKFTHCPASRGIKIIKFYSKHTVSEDIHECN